MRGRSKILALVSMALLLCSSGLRVAAQAAPSGYDELVASGVSAFEAGHYAEARALLQRAQQLKPNARVLRGMGLAAFSAGHYAQASLDIERALAETENAVDDEQRTELERLQAEANARTARFRLTGQQPGAVILIDGEPPLIDAGGFVLMDEGPHTVVLRLAGGDERSTKVQAEGAQWSDLDVSPGRAKAQVNPWAIAPEAAEPSPRALEPIAPEQPAADDFSLRDALIPAAFGGAAIAAGFAVWQWAEREAEVGAWNSEGCLDDGHTRAENCAGHKSAYESAQTWAWVAGGVALALGAGGVALLLADPGNEARDTGARCTPGALALHCRLRF
jgi:hypothetical protein